MIKSIMAGAGIEVKNNYSSWPSFYNNAASANNTLVGQVRYNGSSQTMEVYDGSIWLSISPSYPTVELNSEVQATIDWAMRKMEEEQKLLKLAKNNPVLQDALAALHRAEEQVKIVAALVQE